MAGWHNPQLLIGHSSLAHGPQANFDKGFAWLQARNLLLKLPLPAVMALITLLFAALHLGPPSHLLLTALTALTALANTPRLGLSGRLLPGIAAH